MSEQRRGGGGYMFEGELLDNPREYAKKDTGEVSYYVEIAWFGGSKSLRLADPGQRMRLMRGSWVRALAPIKKFEDTEYAGPCTITHIDGKPFAPGQAA